MKNINSFRVFPKNTLPIRKNKDYILYWMQSSRRIHYNFALEYAVAHANALDLPLLIFMGIDEQEPWLNERTFHLYAQVMESLDYGLQEYKNIRYITYLPRPNTSYRSELHKVCENAAMIISDEYPMEFNEKRCREVVENEITCKFISIDSNGIVPLGLSEKAPYSAYIFRSIVHKFFRELIMHPPVASPLKGLQAPRSAIPFKTSFDWDSEIKDSWKYVASEVKPASILKNVQPLKNQFTRDVGLYQLESFIKHNLYNYEAKRNHPDYKATSGLSPWLHNGTISSYEVVKMVLNATPDWDLTFLGKITGKNRGFYGLNESSESFLDELITWREVGFHFNHHQKNYASIHSLPKWVLETMNQHQLDEREILYSLDQLDKALSYDNIWNAAQIQLRQEGIIHNYMRMLWGKKIIQWTSDFNTALSYMIELNNAYSADGRDPASYCGIMWCLGRFDRPWADRSVFGKLRYMTTESAQKKLKLNEYVGRYQKL